jgi:hypothetical protein
MLNELLILFQKYMGQGLITVWFLLSVIYLFITEKKKEIRVMFVYFPIVILLLFFNPWFAGIIYSVLDEEIYYRLLWMLPVTIVIAYTIVSVWSKLSDKNTGKNLCTKKTCFAMAAVLLIAVSGRFIYTDTYFHPAENIYHVPECVVEICDAIELEGREVTAVFPSELLQYVRQYSGTVCMPYGREVLVDRWNVFNDLYALMESDLVDAQALTSEARSQKCVYIVLPDDKKITGSMEACDFMEFYRTDGYIVYIDSLVNRGI